MECTQDTCKTGQITGKERSVTIKWQRGNKPEIFVDGLFTTSEMHYMFRLMQKGIRLAKKREVLKNGRINRTRTRTAEESERK